ncbi:uroporphyrinogen decarboxylase family protein [Streptococcus oriscaviae]|uniref:Uroporphyrinogen decarboxylase n=1 Tax=Streptococcus oriscaviae TaxID=2781599 RepID=A0ABX7YPM0_9STRE|nr:uroporphyrinogen decarboxylase family protein [Streptococcus oriscaviae]QUE55164.1 uroporphyrinogen decarboxylase [Streptococcus oriscaviae]
MTAKRDLVERAFRGQEVDRVPVGFWYHFTQPEEWMEGLDSPEIYRKNLEGHRQFLKEVQPDLIKLMSDGFFRYPNPLITSGASAQDLARLESIAADHPWFQQQVQLVKDIKASFEEDIPAFYNIFAPATHLKWQLANEVSSGDHLLAQLLEEAPQAVSHALNVIASDLAKLVTKLVEEAGIDGIYLSVQSLQDTSVSPETYHTYLAPSEVSLLETVNHLHKQSILHICGYEGAKNNLFLFTDYPAQVINWAVGAEGVGLAEGRQLFGGKTVLGGFDNTKNGLLYKGSQADIETETKRLIEQAGRQGLILGADCTLPSDISPQRIHWVRQAASK